MTWQALEEELALWQAAGRRAALWWRDDDAIDSSPALDRLLALAAELAMPVGLAVVPAGATEALGRRLETQADTVRVLQHGYAHQNHAPPDERTMELGRHRPAMLVAGELGTGWLALERLFGPRALPVLVPPWNRIDPVLIPILPEIGFCGLSTVGPRSRPQPVRGLVQSNVHVDIIDWRNDRRFAGDEVVLGQLLAAFRRSRETTAAIAEPIGVMTHHLVMDEEAWRFMQRLFNLLKMAQAVSILSADAVFAGSAPRRSLPQ